MATLIAKDTYHVYDRKAGRTITITKGEAQDEKHALVKLAPWAFIDPEAAILDESPTFGPAVEAATAAPGRKRSVKKGGTKK